MEVVIELSTQISLQGTQPGFLFPNSGDPLGTPMDLKKKPFISFKPF